MRVEIKKGGKRFREEEREGGREERRREGGRVLRLKRIKVFTLWDIQRLEYTMVLGICTNAVKDDIWK